MSSFSFSFSGDDIEETGTSDALPDAPPPPPHRSHAAESGTLRSRHAGSAFPIAGQETLKPQTHDVASLLAALPSRIAYSTLSIRLDDGTEMSIPRRELWDVRVQLMAEEDEEGLGNLGKDDVRTGIYEGGFKSWESSVDLVKVLHGRRERDLKRMGKFLELGCGTALPSLAVFQWLLQGEAAGQIDLGLADYNPSVLQLVTLPNLLLSWARVTRQESWEAEGELEIEPEVVQEFLNALQSRQIKLSFFSGSWSPEFVKMVSQNESGAPSNFTIIGAETIYSPAALKSFADTLLGLLDSFPDSEETALVGAKKVYFGVGGSMEDFCDVIRAKGKLVEQVREESDGVRRAVVEVREEARP